MGFFKDIRKLNKLGKEAYMNMDVGAQLAQANASMAQAQQFMDQQARAATMATAPEGALPATATITALRDTGMLVNYQPTVELDLLVIPAGQPPYPATTTATVTVVNRMACQVGREVKVAIDPADRPNVWIDWAASAS